jgi:hypothetical protein
VLKSGYMAIQVFPTSDTYSGGSSAIPTASAYSNDLVFSINMKAGQSLDKMYLDIWIRSVQLEIPVGKKDGCLIEGYNNTDANMVSNRSFYVQFEKTTDASANPAVRITVLPKFGSPSVMEWFQKFIGLSFVLRDVFSSQGSSSATVSVQEYYSVVPVHTSDYKPVDLYARYSFTVTIGE